jgi:hypothetical protein
MNRRLDEDDFVLEIIGANLDGNRRALNIRNLQMFSIILKCFYFCADGNQCRRTVKQQIKRKLNFYRSFFQIIFFKNGIQKIS